MVTASAQASPALLAQCFARQRASAGRAARRETAFATTAGWATTATIVRGGGAWPGCRALGTLLLTAGAALRSLPAPCPQAAAPRRWRARSAAATACATLPPAPASASQTGAERTVQAVRTLPCGPIQRGARIDSPTPAFPRPTPHSVLPAIRREGAGMLRPRPLRQGQPVQVHMCPRVLRHGLRKRCAAHPESRASSSPYLFPRAQPYPH